MKKSREGYVLDKEGNVEGNIAVALSIIADKMPSSDTLRTDHPLQGETLGGIESALENVATALHEIAKAIRDYDSAEAVRDFNRIARGT